MWDGEPPPDLPSNLVTRAWMPQQDLLAHPHTRALVTHGGLLSLQEALYHAVPLGETQLVGQALRPLPASPPG